MTQPAVVRVYIDENGDRGTKQRSSAFFTMVAVVVRDVNDHLVRDFRADLKLRLSIPAAAKLKWTSLSHLQRRAACDALASLPIRLVYVSVPKSNIRDGARMGQDSAAFYNYAAKFLVERVSWIARDAQAVAQINVERVAGFPPRVLLDYLALLRAHPGQSSISWPYVSPRVVVDSPANIYGLTTADIAAGAFDSATRSDLSTGLVEEQYLRTLAPKVWRGSANRTPIGNGLKILGDMTPLRSLTWWPMTELHP